MLCYVCISHTCAMMKHNLAIKGLKFLIYTVSYATHPLHNKNKTEQKLGLSLTKFHALWFFIYLQQKYYHNNRDKMGGMERQGRPYYLPNKLPHVDMFIVLSWSITEFDLSWFLCSEEECWKVGPTDLKTICLVFWILVVYFLMSGILQSLTSLEFSALSIPQCGSKSKTNQSIKLHEIG